MPSSRMIKWLYEDGMVPPYAYDPSMKLHCLIGLWNYVGIIWEIYY